MSRYRKGQIANESLTPYLFMSPAIATLVFVYLVPILFMLAVSATDWTGTGLQFNFIGFKNFVRIFTGGERTMTPIMNVIIIALGTVVFQNIIGLAFALMLDKSFRGRDFFRAIFFMPTVVATIAVAQMWKAMLVPGTGTLAKIAGALGLRSVMNIAWLGNPDIVLYTLIAVNVWQWFGYNLVIYIAGLQAIPTHLYEAAVVDGASTVGKLRHVTLPLLGHSVTTSIVLTTIGALKMFDLPYLLSKGGPGSASTTVTMAMIERMFLNNDYGYAAALGVLLVVAIGMIAELQNRGMRRWREGAE